MPKLKITASCIVDTEDYDMSSSELRDHLLEDSGYEAFDALESASQCDPKESQFTVTVEEITE